MANLSFWHVVIFAIVVLLIFGTSRLKNIGKDVGNAIKDFKQTMQDDNSVQSEAKASEQSQPESKASLKQ